MDRFLLILLVFLVSQLSIAQVTEIKGSSNKTVVMGNVNDINDMPFNGVNVIVKGTAKKTITNLDGNFSLDAENGDILIISYIGFKTTEVVVKNQTKINVILEQDGNDIYSAVNYQPEISDLTRSDIRKARRANKKTQWFPPPSGNAILNSAGEITRELMEQASRPDYQPYPIRH